MDDGALQVVHSCMTALQSLVESLLEGHVLLGDLQACLKYKDQFKRLYQQCMHRTINSNLSRLHHSFVLEEKQFYVIHRQEEHRT